MTRTAARRAVAMAVVGICATLAVRAATAAEATRFIPWTDTPPPAVVLNDLAGRPSAMADYRGKVVLVSFWATWCEFCREQMLAMQQLKQRLAGQPFEIVAVNFAESPPKVREYVKSLAVDFPVVLDPNQDAAKAWRVRVLPVSFVVAADGRPRYTVVGEFDWASDEAINTLRQLLP
ncbi:MAG TPA: TlpA disulfide reductase family protein [Methylomirabilota bacterium]|jgi:thiol-disulfide isomerase/thioredoxin|nr:TlpA disulfide reductase family protein [Methylomirabilota bacterium]